MTPEFKAGVEAAAKLVEALSKREWPDAEGIGHQIRGLIKPEIKPASRKEAEKLRQDYSGSAYRDIQRIFARLDLADDVIGALKFATLSTSQREAIKAYEVEVPPCDCGGFEQDGAFVHAETCRDDKPVGRQLTCARAAELRVDYASDGETAEVLDGWEFERERADTLAAEAIVALRPFATQTEKQAWESSTLSDDMRRAQDLYLKLGGKP